MTRGGNRRQTLTQGLDREVYQVVRKIIDERSQYGDPDTGLSFAIVYDDIKRSNSSLNRKPKKLLEDSIERVLDTIHQDAKDDSDEIVTTEAPTDSQRLKISSGLNKSIVGAWAVSGTHSPDGLQSPKRAPESEAFPMEISSSKRLTNGERPAKRRKARETPREAIDHSPPTHISLASLGGVDNVIQQFEDLLVLPMTRPEIYTSSNVQPPRGVLIHGPPGCGKTMIANAFAAELGVNFISISAPSIVSGMSGESEKALREHFDEARRAAPCLIFIDEIDAITPKRESAQREMEKRIVAQLLTCMDDLALEKTDGKPVIVLAATNRPDALDPALRRGGRFDKEINMTVPSEPVREQILRALTSKTNLSQDIDFALLAQRTPGFVGADLNDLVSTAGAAAIKRHLNMIKAHAESSTMAVDAPDDSLETNISPMLTSLRRLIKYTTTTSPTHSSTANGTEEEAIIWVTMTDFLTALPKIQPSALREGFATVPSTTFSSIGALSRHISELNMTVISPIRTPNLYSNLGITPSSGTLLWGPPGCGKTLLAKACANSSHANFISVKGPELLNKYVGESERAVRQVFSRARSSVPVIIFFDELDALAPRRDGTSSEASARVTNTLLAELDGVGSERDGIYVIAATNRPDMIDPAMLRPGRLETLLFVGLPDAEGRVDILRTLCRKINNFMFDETVADIARSCEGFSGADLKALLQRAGLMAITRCTSLGLPIQDVTIAAADFERAMREVRPSVGADDYRRYTLLQKEFGVSA
ncbi:Ribosome biogenesis ATPase rix7 [Exophiala xenobiotica]|uniref:Ribosome biogenesis ATPase rix7 n=1 Tax=Vermiconidia calcicola TaxID=1690605 RepID=A0AAV9QB50_9PEZI|nr:Ribosome biogenesis ATPase rix7 [Exophiala xenobiotica]KAK5538972.1 Ribosome biogenesis ATPase rix7 [Vermiconidia calcicola]KAK5540458.1 Ribosome biogenesis ATPase rix7 [Chaetothyriales sp. CCFEE 6169]KAK5212489.1 Ribosome biogenesis ATPase rix7 [Exophiala xenobiotica]KAK5224241.1 Ribosome biogenesis ATPase rix7 [Exophiala xenobiotica]